jgi:chorismate dehydratase
LQIPDYRIIGESCIGADGAVASVMLFSRVPLDEITEILLDYQSMTSVNLCKLLCKDYWNIHPAFKNASPGYESRISGTIAGVVIGDRALEMDGDFQYRYDLAAAWKAWTGLPFVFACWVSNKPLEASFVKSFNEALEQGVQRMDEVIRQIRSSGSNLSEQVEQYYKQNLCFHMQDQHRQGLQLFLNKLATI